jgi:hypothetical protein
MNIFVLDEDPQIAAEYHCDKHVCKMILEYAQLLSTAHRLLDGVETIVTEITPKGKERKVKRWIIENTIQNTLWQATHYNHPCAVWVRENGANYLWLYRLLVCLVDEYETRYQKEHSVSKWDPPYTSLLDRLRNPPYKIPVGKKNYLPPWVAPDYGTPFPLCMPEQYKGGDAVQSYRAFYLGEKMKFAKWKYTRPPGFVMHLPEYVHLVDEDPFS